MYRCTIPVLHTALSSLPPVVQNWEGMSGCTDTDTMGSLELRLWRQDVSAAVFCFTSRCNRSYVWSGLLPRQFSGVDEVYRVRMCEKVSELALVQHTVCTARRTQQSELARVQSPPACHGTQRSWRYIVQQSESVRWMICMRQFHRCASLHPAWIFILSLISCWRRWPGKKNVLLGVYRSPWTCREVSQGGERWGVGWMWRDGNCCQDALRHCTL